eukprot:scaffold17100_cov56-Phaeocystis_antarctica.AAC.3
MQSRCSISSTLASRTLPSLGPPCHTCRWTSASSTSARFNFARRPPAFGQRPKAGGRRAKVERADVLDARLSGELTLPSVKAGQREKSADGWCRRVTSVRTGVRGIDYRQPGGCP